MTMTDFDETNSSNYRFAVLSLEYLKWLVCYAASESVPAMETNVDVCIRTAALALENPALSDAVSGLDNGLAAASCVLSLHALLKYRLSIASGKEFTLNFWQHF